MANFQETVDEIRSYVAASNRAPAAAIASRAEEYAQACRDVNDRLRRCSDALHRGLRSDAIQLAEAEPNLLDLVAMLDFPELSGWKAACHAYELTTPPELLIEMASALNEAYAIEQPLASLMANHRVMALARAPLSERLTVMRHIAKLDPASAFWDDDIRIFEHGRLEEMRTQFNQAVKAQDAAAVARLHEEADASTWRISVPQELRTLFKESVERLAAAKAIADLQELLPKLNDAYGAMAYEECKSLLGRWFATTSVARLDVPTELQEQVEPIVAWVRDEDLRRKQQVEFEHACDALQQALDRDQATPVLERAYQAILPFHLEISEELDKRYRQRLAARASAIRHRRKLLYTGIAAGFVLVAGAIAFIAYQKILAREVAEAQTVLSEALNDVQQGELEKGQTLRKQLVDRHPRILSSPIIIKVLNDLDTATSTERQRAADFQKHMDAALAIGVEKPANAELDQAKAIAKTPAETVQIEQFESGIDEFRARKQQEVDRLFVADGSAVGTDLDQKLTEQLMTSNPDHYAQQLAALRGRVEELHGRSGVSSGLKDAQLASLDAVLGRHAQDFERQQKRVRLLDDVRISGSTAERHTASLKQFIAEFPDDPHTQDFQTVVNQLPQEQAIEDWSALVTSWSSQMEPSTYLDAKDRVAAVQQYVDRNASSPVLDSVQAYQAYLKLGLETAAPDGPWKGKLSKLLNNPIVGKLCYLDTTDGLRFYVTSDTQVQAKLLPDGELKNQTFTAITSPDLANPSVITVPLLKSTTPSRSAQAIFAAAVADRIESLNYRDWDVFGIDVVQQLVSQSDMNVVLRGILLQHILQLNQPTAVWSGEDGFGKISDALVAQNVEDIEWLDPRHPPDGDAIKKLQSTIAELPAILAVAKTEVLQRRNVILQAAKFTIIGEGTLLRDKDVCELVTGAPCTTGQIALAIGPDKTLEPVGEAKESKWSLDNGRTAVVTDGSLVFIVSTGK
jgi:hypothetical protein